MPGGDFDSILYPVIGFPPSSFGASQESSIFVGETSSAMRLVGLSGSSADAE